MSNMLHSKWRKVTTLPCAEAYPDHLEFKPNNLYMGQMEAGAAHMPIWDVGRYEILSENAVKISTFNDAEITYEFSISGDRLTFTDSSGCQFQFKREPST